MPLASVRNLECTGIIQSSRNGIVCENYDSWWRKCYPYEALTAERGSKRHKSCFRKVFSLTFLNISFKIPKDFQMIFQINMKSRLNPQKFTNHWARRLHWARHLRSFLLLALEKSTRVIIFLIEPILFVHFRKYNLICSGGCQSWWNNHYAEKHLARLSSFCRR